MEDYTTTIEAESSTTVRKGYGAIVRNGMVLWSQCRTGDYVEFTIPNVPKAGRYFADLRYINPGQMGVWAKILVNGKEFKLHAFVVTKTVGSFHLEPVLQVGKNTIRFECIPDNYLPEMDCLIVSAQRPASSKEISDFFYNLFHTVIVYKNTGAQVRAFVTKYPAVLNMPDPWRNRGEGGLTVLGHLAGKGYDRDTFQWLIAQGADVNARSANGVTPLMVAVGHDNEDAVLKLLNRGAKVNAKNSAGDSPLHIAVTHQSKSIVRLLVEKGADKRAENRQGYTPYDLATLARNPIFADLVRP